jgi:flagellar basal body-associated protein FliL
MKQVEERPSQGILVLYRILVGVLLVLVLVIASVTAYTFISRGLDSRNGEAPTQEEGSVGEENIFSGIGTMRISTTGEDPETVIITIAFPYDSKDIPFSEELVSRIPDFKASITDYFGSLSAEELQAKESTEIGDILLDRFNTQLRLGKIKKLFFIDYIWL